MLPLGENAGRSGTVAALRFAGARITGRPDLTGAGIRHAFRLDGCGLEQPVSPCVAFSSRQRGGISASRDALLVIMRIFRTYARAYADDLDAVLAPLTTVTGEPVSTRFTMPNGLELATVGQLLVVAGDERALEPYRATVATLIIDDLDDCQALLNRTGARIVRGPQAVPTGRNLTAELPGGVQIEYVEWDDAQWERAGGRPA
ncbi:hypothetical protein SCATT_p16110 (plasmid) [Streptantibioticus cattleyicolor NRRL 8057 = DSM 46488]|uniref:Uncharacterized protein n=1 Tax=Streptantibioticus cattleyicolor (strain ATCC 35852 / DSM 46488 / JCM 4925 / NBRC 14057 / NRRL 8057) TaxID=1003195 RepID=G8XHG7_STREN|nr:hypothetical protein SCATT_p16110 [Streptantibioticus cattleyicolor NRRL 8057 = DSM 46488]